MLCPCRKPLYGGVVTSNDEGRTRGASFGGSDVGHGVHSQLLTSDRPGSTVEDDDGQ
jgi:hypothetical protein